MEEEEDCAPKKKGERKRRKKRQTERSRETQANWRQLPEVRNHVKQRERNSRGDGERVAILRKETEEIFRSYRVEFIWTLPLFLSVKNAHL